MQCLLWVWREFVQVWGNPQEVTLGLETTILSTKTCIKKTGGVENMHTCGHLPVSWKDATGCIMRNIGAFRSLTHTNDSCLQIESKFSPHICTNLTARQFVFIRTKQLHVSCKIATYTPSVSVGVCLCVCVQLGLWLNSVIFFSLLSLCVYEADS